MMDKYGTSNADLLQGLQNEEANLMQEIQKTLDPDSKTASSRPDLESRLHNVRTRIDEIRKAMEG